MNAKPKPGPTRSLSEDLPDVGSSDEDDLDALFSTG